MILVDLAAVDSATLLEVVERAWRAQAPKKLVREWDERHYLAPAQRSRAKKRTAKKRAKKKR